MSFRNRWIAALATLIMGATLFMSALPNTSVAQAADTGKDAAATALPPPPVAETAKEVVENPYGLDALWKGGDFVSRGTLVILALMSLGSWYIMFTKFYEQFKLMGQAGAVRKTFWAAGSLSAGIQSLKDGSPFRYIAETGIGATGRHEGPLLERIDLNTWISMSVQRAVENVQSRLQDGLAFLATVGSTAPFVGLFGTVWGIYHALTEIGIAGQASIDKVAGPVGEALIMTAFGLAVAVPAVLGYNFLVRRNKVAMESVRAFGADLHLALLGQTANAAR
ncbi:MAG TPA: MotA/TolQ/ExbB proton channel family protein [Burkholderiaceae bacterium]|nr:MotA/TolQ/ExbB proton channel family protein [Burkholderiaceae bacterium]HYB50690.1 MotA/TolQ/ExbB proton channel family protein [Burkholderiaceae bacterium]